MKKIIVVFIILMVVINTALAKKVSEEFYQGALKLVKERKYNEASFEFRKVFALENKGKLAEKAKFYVGFYSTDPFVCIVEMKEFLELFPKSELREDAIIVISNNYYLLDNLLRSEEYLKKYAEEYPDGKYIYNTYFWLGVISFHNRLYDLAIENLNKVINGTKDSNLRMRTLTYLAYCYNKKDNKEKYKEVLKKISASGIDTRNLKQIVQDGQLVYKVEEGYYTLQLGSFASLENAESMKSIMISSGYTDILIIKSGKYYRVYLGKFKTKEEANRFLTEFKKKNTLNPIIVKVK